MKINNNFWLYSVFVLCLARRDVLSAAIGASWKVEHILPYDFVRYVIEELMIIWNELQVIHTMNEESTIHELEVAVESVINHIIDVNSVVGDYYDMALKDQAICVEKIEYIMALIHKIKLVYILRKKESFLLSSGYSSIEEYLVMLENNLFYMLDACYEFCI